MLTTDITALDHPPALYSPVSTASTSGAGTLAPSFPSLGWHTANGSKTSAISLSGIDADTSDTQTAPRIVLAANTPIGRYGPWTASVKNVRYWDDASAATGEKEIQNTTFLSPEGLSTATDDILFLRSNRLIAHRGLVDLANGIPENSLAAVQNAFNHHLNLVEIDVQSTSDGIAVPLHDLSLNRPLIDDANVNSLTISDIRGASLYIKNPVSPLYSGGGDPWYKTGSSIQTLSDLLTAALKSNPNATFFLDPKNLQAAEAAARVVMNDTTIAEHTIMKTYTPYWGTGAYTSVFGQAHTTEQQNNLRRMKIMPVDNLTAYSGGMGSAGAAAVVVDDIAGWGKRFCVVAVELPGYWNSNWYTLNHNVDAKMTTSILPNNPYDRAARNVWKPVISTGYRFEDFSIDGKPFDWGMDGQPKEDLVDSRRRTIGSARLSHGWITTDNPLQEALAIKDDFAFPQSGNPHQAITIPKAPSYGTGDTGDQGGP